MRPLPESGIKLFGLWLENKEWQELEEAQDINEKVKIFHSQVIEKIYHFLPEKNIKINSDDSPWCNDRIKHLKRLKCCEYSKHRKSNKWITMHENYQKVLKQEKQKYYDKVVKDLKHSDPNQWYSKLKRLCSYDLEKHEILKCEEINHMENKKQANRLAEHFSTVRSKFDALNSDETKIPHFEDSSLPHFSQFQVEEALKIIKTKKSVPPGDIPSKVLKHHAKFFSKPIAIIFNCAMKQGKWPEAWKKEIVTPVAKRLPTQTHNKSEKHKWFIYPRQNK